MTSSIFNLATGYCRSESVGAIFLQRRKDARRVYARLIHTKINMDGFKPEGIHCPSLKMQTLLQQQFYQECNIDSSCVEFLECHGSGTQVSHKTICQNFSKMFKFFFLRISPTFHNVFLTTSQKFSLFSSSFPANLFSTILIRVGSSPRKFYFEFSFTCRLEIWWNWIL